MQVDEIYLIIYLIIYYHKYTFDVHMFVCYVSVTIAHCRDMKRIKSQKISLHRSSKQSGGNPKISGSRRMQWNKYHTFPRPAISAPPQSCFVGDLEASSAPPQSCLVGDLEASSAPPQSCLVGDLEVSSAPPQSCLVGDLEVSSAPPQSCLVGNLEPPVCVLSSKTDLDKLIAIINTLTLNTSFL